MFNICIVAADLDLAPVAHPTGSYPHQFHYPPDAPVSTIIVKMHYSL